MGGVKRWWVVVMGWVVYKLSRTAKRMGECRSMRILLWWGKTKTRGERPPEVSSSVILGDH